MRRRRIYSLILENRSRLENVVKWDFTLGKMTLAAASLIIMCILLGGILVAVTPLRRLLPGYSGIDGRRETVEALLRLDSLQAKADAQSLYLENLRSVIGSTRSAAAPDSAGMALGDFNPDELLDPSEREQLFIARMNERERAQGRMPSASISENIFFCSPAPGAVMGSDPVQSGAVLFRIPEGSAVESPADGRVVDKYRTQEGYVLVIQHGDGYLSRFSMLQSPLVDAGQKVDTGEPVALLPRGTGRNINTMRMELWHNGIKLNPTDYIRVPALSS